MAYRQLKVGAGVLIELDSQLLLVQRGDAADAFPGTWNLPAGYCESDEAPAITAEREATEETGLRVRAGRLRGAHFFDDDPRGNGVLFVYDAQVEGGELRCDGLEAQAARYFSPEAVPKALCGGGHDKAIAAWRRRAQDRWQPGMQPRFCPHCTLPLVERDAFGRTRPVCSACGFVHFREPKVGVSALVEERGQLLLVRRAIDPGMGKWSLPSGFVDWDESPQAALVRECAEETGLAVADPVLWEVHHYTDDFRGPGVNFTYRVRVAGGTLCAGDDASDVRFYAPQEVPRADQIAFQTHVHTVEQWIASITETAASSR
ncbi:NUDIX domain-containing protein [Chloroflexota bacterium]